MNVFSLKHLDETEFEEFCYEILVALGAKNISWRKGTGLASSPVDRGRDIECFFEQRDVDGTVTLERWFVECKHYEKGVPPEKLQGALAWARAERPDKLVFIASNFFSNAAKDNLNSLEKNERPPFKIKIWEKPDLEKLSLGKTKLRRKYKIGGDFPHLAALHPAHVLYSKNLNSNTLEYFFETLDKLNAKKRDEILGFVSLLVINPEFREPVSKDEKLGDLIVGDLSYEAFKNKLRLLSKAIPPIFLVQAIVDFILRTLFHSADETNIERWKETDEWMIKEFEERVARGEKVELHESMIKISKNKLLNTDRQTKERYALYEYFCENAVLPLLLEKIAIGED